MTLSQNFRDGLLLIVAAVLLNEFTQNLYLRFALVTALVILALLVLADEVRGWIEGEALHLGGWR